MESLPSMISSKTKMPMLAISTQHGIGSPMRVVRQEKKKVKCIYIGKEEVQLFVCR